MNDQLTAALVGMGISPASGVGEGSAPGAGVGVVCTVIISSLLPASSDPELNTKGKLLFCLSNTILATTWAEIVGTAVGTAVGLAVGRGVGVATSIATSLVSTAPSMEQVRVSIPLDV
ncbi:hypothetical protein SDC9_188665 [bioreactor metagenome]|uniref:Uncharacterized protein n=1 Tax=bioreactor metagenome TaxID=1076179 RepID=A0A645I0R6_9ZZZZ